MIRWGSIALIALFFVYLFVNMSSQVEWAQIGRHPLLFLAAVGFEILNIGGQFLIWFLLIRRAGSKTSLASAYSQFSISMLSRYLPGGKVVQPASLAYFSDKSGSRINSLLAYVVLTLTGAYAGVPIAIAGMAFFFPTLNLEIYFAIAWVLLSIWLWIAPPFRMIHWAAMKLKKIDSSESSDTTRFTRGSLAIAVIAGFLLCWVPEGMSAICLLRMINPSYSWGEVVFLLSSHAIAAFGGYVAIFAPGGLGVKEMAWIGLLTRRLKLVEASFLSFGLRFVLMAAEAVFCLPLLLQVGRWRKLETQETR